MAGGARDTDNVLQLRVQLWVPDWVLSLSDSTNAHGFWAFHLVGPGAHEVVIHSKYYGISNAIHREHRQNLTLASSSGLFRMVEARLATAVTPVPPARSPAQIHTHRPAQRTLRHLRPAAECSSDLCMCATSGCSMQA